MNYLHPYQSIASAFRIEGLYRSQVIKGPSLTGASSVSPREMRSTPFSDKWQLSNAQVESFVVSEALYLLVSERHKLLMIVFVAAILLVLKRHVISCKLVIRVREIILKELVVVIQSH